MNASIKKFVIRTLAVTAIAAGSMTAADAQIIFPVYCHYYTVPVTNPYTGFTWLVTRRVCHY